MGSAVLSIYVEREKRVVDLEVTWDRGFDKDAKMKVPVRFKSVWQSAMRDLRREHRDRPVRPYPTLRAIQVSADQITKSATGFYAIARDIWEGVGWRVPPPYPEAEAPSEGAIP